MARALIVGCGCRGRALGGRLSAAGLAVRGTSRTEEGLASIEAAGIEPALADPLRPGTILELVGDVALVVWLLGSAAGGPDDVAAIHGERLESLLAKLVDTPVRGIAYEAAGAAGEEVLGQGRELIGSAAATWSIPVAFLEESPRVPGREAEEALLRSDDWDAWSAASCEAVIELLR